MPANISMTARGAGLCLSQSTVIAVFTVPTARFPAHPFRKVIAAPLMLADNLMDQCRSLSIRFDAKETHGKTQRVHGAVGQKHGPQVTMAPPDIVNSER